MMEFLEKNWRFLIFVICLGSFVIYSVNKDRKEEEKKNKNNKDNKREGE